MFKKTKNITIKPFEPEDVPVLEKWVYSGDYEDFFRDLLTLTKEQLKIYAYMKDGQAFIIWNEGNPVGFIVLYEMRSVPLNMKLAILIDTKYQEQKFGFEAMKLCFDYIFNKMNFEKVIMEVLASAHRLCKVCEKGGFRREAILEKEARVNGCLVDVVRYMIFKKDYRKYIAEGFYG